MTRPRDDDVSHQVEKAIFITLRLYGYYIDENFYDYSHRMRKRVCE